MVTSARLANHRSGEYTYSITAKCRHTAAYATIFPIMSLAGSCPDPLPALTLAAPYKTRALSATASLTVLRSPASGAKAGRADIVGNAGRDGQRGEVEAE